MVGNSVTRADIDNKAASLAQRTRDLLHEIDLFQQWLGQQDDATLAGYNYTANEIATLKSAFAQLDQMRQVATGQAGGQTAANNYLFFSNKLTGLA